MHLLLYIGNDLIESAPLDSTKITLPGYVGTLKRELEQKHDVEIRQAIEEPEFLIFDLEEQSPT